VLNLRKMIHAFISLEDDTKNLMRFDEPFDSRYSRQIAYNDSEIGITYPINNPILAPHDIIDYAIYDRIQESVNGGNKYERQSTTKSYFI